MMPDVDVELLPKRRLVLRRQGWEGVFTFSLEVETYTGVVLSNRMQVGHEVAAVLQAKCEVRVRVLRDVADRGWCRVSDSASRRCVCRAKIPQIDHLPPYTLGWP